MSGHEHTECAAHAAVPKQYLLFASQSTLAKALADLAALLFENWWQPSSGNGLREPPPPQRMAASSWALLAAAGLLSAALTSGCLPLPPSG